MSIYNKINIAIIGATGYTGLDLVYILSKHPRVKIKQLCATKNLGKKISFFDKRIKKKLPNISSVKKVNWSNLDLVFLSLPNGEAQKLLKKIYFKNKNLKFIDLSADFRISNTKIFERNYNFKHKAKTLIKDSFYSLPELNNQKIDKFKIISNPGCYPTSIQLPLVPLFKKNMIKNNNITIDSKSGYSGAGKNLEKKFKHKNLFSSTFAYNTKNHRHICEIDQQFLKLTKKKIYFSFNPHLLPTFRGILTSIYVQTNKGITGKILRKSLINYYKNSKFIKILKLNSSLGSGNVLNTNNCEISICETRIKKKFVIFSAIDNLIKGASGQAVQNMNLLFKFPEHQGLK
ncbi:N-acetyl-gamma-glutamyl-phosphate reductase [Pelagibacterales bacterium SAG-MED41]|nr:N-acetyl-gamma-glutamyl-phosphate reductase [Pelagibacterales bacterium SAG-MED41]|tara:strand:+ start:19 stop:1056 length:1038 start_codon:yes stop_codon:yes gene_type:complete